MARRLTEPIDETYIRVRGRWRYLYRAIDRDGALVDVMLSEHRDLAAARAFFRSAKAVTGVTPDRVTTDGHDAYPRAIRTELGKQVRHRTSRYLNNRLEQDHRGIKDRCRPMLGLKSTCISGTLLPRLWRTANFLRCRSHMRQHVPAAERRWRHMRENRDCPRCPGNSLSAGDEGRSLPNSRARKLTEPSLLAMSSWSDQGRRPRGFCANRASMRICRFEPFQFVGLYRSTLR